MTSRCNQDVLENLFSVIRGMGGTYSMPTPAEFFNRMRILLMGGSAKLLVSARAPVAGVPEEEAAMLPLQPEAAKPSTPFDDEKFVMAEMAAASLREPEDGGEEEEVAGAATAAPADPEDISKEDWQEIAALLDDWTPEDDAESVVDDVEAVEAASSSDDEEGDDSAMEAGDSAVESRIL